MDYKEAMEYIHEAQKFGSRPGLESIGKLLEYLGNPQKRLKYVHVAGTNGKGSTVAFISQILMEAGYLVGIYTSPYIQRFSERIKVNNEEIPEVDIARITGMIKQAVDRMVQNGEENPTEFDMVTTMGFLYFAEQHCDIVVLEVGLGGRLDSTNTIDSPEVAVITTISYDHMDVLGDTLDKIAFEKAGIIKTGCDVVLYPQEPEIEKLFERICTERHAKLHEVELSDLRPAGFGLSGQKFGFNGYKALKISLLGDHQMSNAAVAVKTVEVLNAKGYCISKDAVRSGLNDTKWPGRFEIIQKNPFFLIDGAHNVQGVSTLKEGLCKYFPGKKFTFLVGVLADKEYQAMMAIIAPLAERFITVTPENPRALDAQDLAKYLARYGKQAMSCESIEAAIRKGTDLCGQDGMLCAFGSLYYIGKVRELLGLR